MINNSNFSIDNPAVSLDSAAIRIVSIEPSRKSNALADISIELSFESHQITISDFRVLKNRQGGIWLAPPAFAVARGKTWEYFQTVTFDSLLKRQIDDAAITAFEHWESEQASPSALTPKALGGAR